MFVCMRVHLCKYSFMYVCVCMCVHLCMYVFVYVFVCMHGVAYMFVCVFTYVCMCVFMYVCACMHVCMYFCTYALKEEWKDETPVVLRSKRWLLNVTEQGAIYKPHVTLQR